MTDKSLFGARKYNFIGEVGDPVLTAHLVVFSDFDTLIDSYAESFLIQPDGEIFRDRFKNVAGRWYRIEDGSESELPKELLDLAQMQKLGFELVGCQHLDWI